MSNDTYLGNPLLKPAHIDIQWTPMQLKEYIRCARDMSYFIKTYVKIVNLDEGLILFDLYPYQEQMVETVDKNRFTIIKTCRQAGKTTTSAAILLWHMLFIENYSVAILANKLQTSREILSRVQRAYEHMPKWLQQGIVSWNKTSMELENGSTAIAAATGSSAIRGMSINFLYLDEFAFVPKNIQEDFFTSVYPTIISGTQTKVVITSTPNGFDLFYKMWMDSTEERNEYANFSVNWWDVPGRDEEWKDKTIANTSEHQFRQEFEAEFIGSSDTLIDPNTLRRLAFRTPIGSYYNDDLKIYKEPETDHVYFCTVDTARGSGIDASAFLIYDLTKTPYEVVAAYTSNLITPLVYPEIIHQVCSNYGECPVLVEINDIGQQIADILHTELEYENVIFTTVKGRRGQQLSGGFTKVMQRGVRTTPQVKRIGCANLKTMVEMDKVILNDFKLINELSVFIRVNSSYEAEPGYHDDLVMCMVLFAWATQQQFFKELTNTDFRRRLMEEKERMIKDDMLPFGLMDDGREEENINNTMEVFHDHDDYNKIW